MSDFGSGTSTSEVIEGVDLKGKCALVTGASSGLGVETSRSLASAGAAVIMVARDASKLDTAVAQVRASVPDAQLDTALLDLADLESVRAGAQTIVAADVADLPLTCAKAMGADHTINLMKTPDALAAYKADKGQFDVVFEASGSAPAFMNALDVVRARGVVVVVGVGAEVNLPLSQIVAKEVDVRGTFRFHSEFATAVRFLNDRLVDGRPVITGTQPLSAAVAAFDMAADKSKSLKVQIAFDA